MGEKFCPKCGSEDVELEAGGVSGNYRCNKCGYMGIVPEREDYKTEEEKRRTRKKE